MDIHTPLALRGVDERLYASQADLKALVHQVEREERLARVVRPSPITCGFCREAHFFTWDGLVQHVQAVHHSRTA